MSEDRERLGAGRNAAAGEPFGAGKEVEQDVLRRQRGDREIKPLQPRGGQAEDQADRRVTTPASGMQKKTGTPNRFER